MDDYRILLLAPTRPDRVATLELFKRAQLEATPCDGVATLAAETERSVGAIVMTDAAFADPHIGQLRVALSHQPPWSDVPIILLCRSSGPAIHLRPALKALRNVTLLERPTSSLSLLSSVQAALRARTRQYQLRDHLEALRASEAALREADRRKDLFLATLAHELRNPLAPIRTAAQLLAAPKLEPSRLQWAQQVIQRQVGHMALLLDDLLDIARITQGKLELKKRRVALTEIVDSAIEAARPAIEKKNHLLKVRLPAADLSIEADPLRLSQVLANLLTNAAKYTDAAGHIELSGHVEDGVLRLSVKDDGIGISAEALPQIFEMFSQVDAGAAHSDGGLGIGLALVHGLLKLHDGKIEALSAGLGQGSEFIVHLPLGRAELPAATTNNSEAPAIAATGRRVLIADDNKDAADALAMLLELADHEVRVVYSGRAAVTLAQTFRPEVAFIDIGMPDCSGYEVAEAIRREPWGKIIFLVALTGWGQEGDRQRATVAGFNRHLTKPVDLSAIETLLAEKSASP